MLALLPGGSMRLTPSPGTGLTLDTTHALPGGSVEIAYDVA